MIDKISKYHHYDDLLDVDDDDDDDDVEAVTDLLDVFLKLYPPRRLLPLPVLSINLPVTVYSIQYKQ